MDTFEKIILFIISEKPANKAEFDDARRRICSRLRIAQPGNRHLLKAYQDLLKKKRVDGSRLIEELLKKATMRSQSGVAIITSLVKPFFCPGKCTYCPTEVKMPKSYIATEPAAARALRLNFSPYEQMKQRILMLQKNGHPVDKIEFIVKGGTWNAYELKYQYWFILESFRACNELSRKNRPPETEDESVDRNVRDGRLGAMDKQPENQPYASHNLNISLGEWQSELESEQRKNEKSKHRIIGLTLETRPDAINPVTIKHLRQLGCTRVELGLQATDDRILERVKRGHTVEQFRVAMASLREAGFKVDLHFMPDLPGSDPEHDLAMYREIFSDPGLKPDMIKIYPCTVVKNTELYDEFKRGEYIPYGNTPEMFEALIQMKLATPRYCRISRLIRDIPANEIEAGNIITNLRETLIREMKKRDLNCRCLRCREIGHIDAKTQKRLSGSAPIFFVDRYETIGGDEYFLSFEDKKRTAVFGFARLRLPAHSKKSKLNDAFPELKGCAFIRELHVYGQLIGIGEKNKDASQHKGLGKKLMGAAEKIATEKNFKKVAVISGVGVRGYYRKLGYRKVKTYMIKKLSSG